MALSPGVCSLTLRCMVEWRSFSSVSSCMLASPKAPLFSVLAGISSDFSSLLVDSVYARLPVSTSVFAAVFGCSTSSFAVPLEKLP